MSSFWDSIKQGIQTVSGKTEEMAKVGRIKLAILATKRDIEKDFIELGGRIYHLIRNKQKINVSKDETIKNLVDRIQSFELKLEELKHKLDLIQSEKKEDEG